jgi:hypothetical protein
MQTPVADPHGLAKRCHMNQDPENDPSNAGRTTLRNFNFCERKKMSTESTVGIQAGGTARKSIARTKCQLVCQGIILKRSLRCSILVPTPWMPAMPV